MEWNLCFPSALTGLGSNCYLLRCDFHLGEKHSLFFSYTALPQTFLSPGWYASSSFLPGSEPCILLEADLMLFSSTFFTFPPLCLSSCTSRDAFLLISVGRQMLPSSFTKPFQNALIKNPCLISLWTFFPRPCNDCSDFLKTTTKSQEIIW